MENSGAGDFSVQSIPDGEPSLTEFTYNGGGGLTTVEVKSYTLYPVIQRSRRGKAITYFMFTINWLMALCSVITTFNIYNRCGQVGDGAILLSITIILAIPAIRNIYPGSPSYGIFLGTRLNHTTLPPRIDTTS